MITTVFFLVKENISTRFFRIRGERDWPKNTVVKRGQHSSDAITDLSIDWLKNGWTKKQPFFLMHHFKAPHDMFQNAKRYDTFLKKVYHS